MWGYLFRYNFEKIFDENKALELLIDLFLENKRKITSFPYANTRHGRVVAETSPSYNTSSFWPPNVYTFKFFALFTPFHQFTTYNLSLYENI